MTLSGRLKFEFGGVECEIGGIRWLCPAFADQFRKFFINRTRGIDVVSSHQQSTVQKCETAFNT